MTGTVWLYNMNQGMRSGVKISPGGPMAMFLWDKRGGVGRKGSTQGSLPELHERLMLLKTKLCNRWGELL